MRPDSLIDFGAIKVSYLLTYLLINFVTFQVKTCKPRLATPVQGAAIGKFNSLIPIPLLICPESFVVIAATVSHTVAMLTNIVSRVYIRVGKLPTHSVNPPGSGSHCRRGLSTKPRPLEFYPGLT